MLETVLLQAANGGPDFDMTWVLMGGIALIFYFFMIRPQQKKQKDQKNFLSEIKKGDSVITIGGLHGKVFSVDENLITLEVDRGVKMTFDKSSISLEFSSREKDKK